MEQQKSIGKMDFSVIHYFGMQASRCGYCKGIKSSKAHGMHAYTMLPQDYQALINRGWRRSGQYCYKPLNSTTCCPSYTIKCNALDFKLSKSHKKVLKRMTRFLRDGKRNQCEKECADKNNNSDDDDSATGKNFDSNCDIHAQPKAPDQPLPMVDLNFKRSQDAEERADSRHKIKITVADTCETSAAELATTSQRSLKKQNFKNYNISSTCKKAKQMRNERRQTKLIEKGMFEIPPKYNARASEKTLADYIADISPNDKHSLKIVMLRSRSLKVEKNVHTLYRKYQFTVHHDSPDHVTPTSLERFLYKSPLQYDNSNGSPPEGYGSFHQQYWLDDKLIAVGVLDILPQCLSSVYFFYDPDYSFLSLGTYATLREIEFVQQLSKVTPELKFYYMGFYIHSCEKMRYKGKLVPSELLCPETYTWILLTEDIRKKLDEKNYQRLNPDKQVKDTDEFKLADLNQVLLLMNNQLCTYGQYVQISGDEDEHNIVLEYGELVGKECAHRMVFIKA